MAVKEEDSQLPGHQRYKIGDDKYEMSMKFLVIDDMNMMDKYHEMSMKDQATLNQGGTKTLQGKAPLERINTLPGMPRHYQHRHPQHWPPHHHHHHQYSHQHHHHPQHPQNPSQKHLAHPLGFLQVGQKGRRGQQKEQQAWPFKHTYNKSLAFLGIFMEMRITCGSLLPIIDEVQTGHSSSSRSSCFRSLVSAMAAIDWICSVCNNWISFSFSLGFLDLLRIRFVLRN